MVAILSFAEDAVVHQAYLDVASAANLLTAGNVIDGLNVASGTNIEGGLCLAANLMEEHRKSGGSIANVPFKITSLEAPVSWNLTATSDANGNMFFTNIPSGHAFFLEEVSLPNYEPIGDIGFTVDWGTLTLDRNAPMKTVGGVYTLENHYEPYHSRIRVHKHFYGDIEGADAFAEKYRELYNDPTAEPTVTADIYRGTLTLEEVASAEKLLSLELSETDAWTATTDALPVGEYTIVENGDGITLPGYSLAVNHPLHITIDRDTHGKVIISNLGNTYTEEPPVIPPIPETGDTQMPLLWFGIATLAAAAYLVLHTRKKA